MKLSKEAAALHVLDFWVEIDSNHATYKEAMQIVNSLSTPPIATVVSENGIQAYYKFNESFEVIEEDPYKFIKELSLKLHTTTKVDKTENLVHLLQVQNSFNVENILDTMLYSLVGFAGVTYCLESFIYLNGVQEANGAVATIEVNKEVIVIMQKFTEGHANETY